MSMLNKLKNRSLVLTGSIILAIFMIIIIAVMEWFSYVDRKADFEGQIERIGNVLADNTSVHLEAIAIMAEHMKEGTSDKSESYDLLKRTLNLVKNSDQITNTYLFFPEISENDGKTSLTFLAINDTLAESGIQSGSSYTPSESYLATFKKVLEGGRGLTDEYTDDVGTWVSYLAPIKNDKGDIIAVYGADYDYDKIEDQLRDIIMKNVLIGIIVSFICILIIVALLRLTLKPLEQLARSAALAAKGDLTQKVAVKNGNEIGRAAEAFNVMTESLRQLTSSVRTATGQVAEAAQMLQDSSTQTAQATEEVAGAVQEVAAGSDTQLQSTEECQRAMNEMAIGIERIAESSSSVAEMTSDTADMAAEGETIIQQTVEQMRTISAKMENTVATLEELDQLSTDIQSILDMINDVANQTNLLALNASIEAARAGEHGKGFAVVANEIRMLAERSKTSSDQIRTILEGTGNHLHLLVGSMEQTKKEAFEGSRITQQAGESFRSIVSSIRAVNMQVQEVSAAAEQMSASGEEIAASLDQLAHIASTSSDHAQRVAAASEEQLASMEEVASSADQLRDTAEKLNEEAKRFKV